MIPKELSNLFPKEMQWHIQSFLSTPTADIIKKNVIMNTPLPWHLLNQRHAALNDSDDDDDDY
jgi:hypothetical protein